MKTLNKTTLLSVPMPTSVLNKTQVTVVSQELDRIWSENRNLKPKTIVDEARPKSAPLHDFFTWEDGAAAELWRESEARGLIRSIRVIRDDMPAKEQPIVRRYMSVEATEDEDRFDGHSYMPMSEVAKNSDYRQQVLNAAMKELRLWRQRHDGLNEFLGIYSEIESVERSLKMRSKAKPVKRR